MTRFYLILLIPSIRAAYKIKGGMFDGSANVRRLKTKIASNCHLEGNSTFICAKTVLRHISRYIY